MSNPNNRNRNQSTGISLVATALGLAVGLAAAEHVNARHENRESLIQGVGRWLRDTLIQPTSHSAIQQPPTPRPMSRAEIDALPVRKLSLRDINREPQVQDEKTCCVVCRDGYARGDNLMRLPCFHEFHTDCIRDYLESTNLPLCPICRHPVTFP